MTQPNRHFDFESITGNEISGEYPKEVQALIQFYSAFNRRDMTMMADNWLQTEEISMCNPLGGTKRGWAEISAVYRKIFTGKAIVYVEFYDYTILKSVEFYHAVGKERGYFRRDTEEVELAIRTSRIFTLRNGLWKQVHHHGSIDDPGLLKRYQSAVKAGS